MRIRANELSAEMRQKLGIGAKTKRPAKPAAEPVLLPPGTLLAKFTAPGCPQQWRTYPTKDARTKRYAGEMRRYQAFKDWQTAVYYLAQTSRRQTKVTLYEGPVQLSATFIVPEGARPADIDNLRKALSDALEGAVYYNDRQIVATGGVLPGPERRCGAPATHVEVWTIGEDVGS
jgi:Holliday junction resolvase RusA-like endonuclease